MTIIATTSTGAPRPAVKRLTAPALIFLVLCACSNDGPSAVAWGPIPNLAVDAAAQMGASVPRPDVGLPSEAGASPAADAAPDAAQAPSPDAGAPPPDAPAPDVAPPSLDALAATDVPLPVEAPRPVEAAPALDSDKPPAAGGISYVDLGGAIFIEAESFSAKVEAAGTRWLAGNDVAGFSGAGYVRSEISDRAETCCSTARLEYEIEVSAAGDYYTAVRGRGDSGSDSVYVTVGAAPVARTSWNGGYHPSVWVWGFSDEDSEANRAPGYVPFKIKLPKGKVTVQLYAREGDALIDQIALVRDRKALSAYEKTPPALADPDASNTTLHDPPAPIPPRK